MAFLDDLFSLSWLLGPSEGRILMDVHGQESLCDFGMCTPVFYSAKWRLLCIDRCNVCERSCHVHESGCPPHGRRRAVARSVPDKVRECS